MSTSLHARTPSVTVRDARAALVREIACHRHPAAPAITALRITRHRYGPRGDCTHSADPRLGEAGSSNFRHEMTLAGAPLRTRGVDDGTKLTLQDAAGRPLLAVGNIAQGAGDTPDVSQALTRTWQYEDRRLAGRLLSITECTADSEPRVVERFVHADNTAANQALNLVGRCIGHYDPAGLLQTDTVALTGIASALTRHLSADLGARQPHWPDADPSACNDLLDDEPFTTTTTTDAIGATLTSTDAKGNRQRLAYDVAGGVSGSWLTLAGCPERAIITALIHSAAGQKLQETHGNGVVSTCTYEPKTQRLADMRTARPAGHPQGAKVLQDLRYTYDPVGNVVKVADAAQPTRFWRNQRVSAETIYVYDSLYQLVSASGREMARGSEPGVGLPPASVPIPIDASAYTNYTRTYHYDCAGNLTRIRHGAPAVNRSYATELTVSNGSNRAVSSTLTEDPSAVDALFTAGGQQRRLQPGQALGWTPRNELAQVTPIMRDAGGDDVERYRYDAASQRVSKFGMQTTGSGVHTQRTLYLPGLELCTHHTGATLTQQLQVIRVGDAGRTQVHVLYWEHGKPAGLPDDSMRYSHDTLTGSSGLEVDGEGQMISLEEYYPYGGTAVWAARSQVEAGYKTRRHSGKERDATGLYYYGYRYYLPWLGRWLSADPAGTVDGLNLFRMCRNNPIIFHDSDGRNPDDVARRWLQISREKRAHASFARMHTYGADFGGTPISSKFALPTPEAQAEQQELLANLGDDGERPTTSPASRPSMQEQAKRNKLSLIRRRYSSQQLAFVKHFSKQDFYLVHATATDLATESGNINIFSRKMLQDNGKIFPEENTTQSDLDRFATDDYAFFSLELGATLKKSQSRFGNIAYRIPATNAAFEYASLSLVDPMSEEFPNAQIPGLSHNGRTQLETREMIDANSAFFDGMRNSKVSLALHIAQATNHLSNAADKNLILNERDPDRLDTIMNHVFRPEVRVPRMAGITKGNFTRHQIRRFTT